MASLELLSRALAFTLDLSLALALAPALPLPRALLQRMLEPLSQRMAQSLL